MARRPSPFTTPINQRGIGLPTEPVAPPPVVETPTPEPDIETAEERIARERAEAEALRQQQEAEFNSRLSSMFDQSIADAESFFSSRGVDPNLYREDISREANLRRSFVPDMSADIGSYFSGIGADVYSNLSDALRTRSITGVNQAVTANDPSTRILDTADDDIISQILSEQRTPAEQQAQLLFDRGLVTESGLENALADIERQAGLGGNRLQELGLGILNQGRSGIGDFISESRTAASNANLANQFDLEGFEADLSNRYNDFFSGLGEQLRSQAPTDLFDVSGLGAISGAAGGAKAAPLFGPVDEEEPEEEDEEQKSAF